MVLKLFPIPKVDYPEIAEGIFPRHRFMSAYEQKVGLVLLLFRVDLSIVQSIEGGATRQEVAVSPLCCRAL